MNISAPFIQRPVMTSLCMICLIMMGIMAYRRLPVSDMPDVDYPTINVKVSYPGASPETMANNVALPLEQQLMTISGLNSITSSNTLGNTSIILQFDLHKSIDSAAQDVQTAINTAQSQLPQNLPNNPTYTKVNPADTPILYLALTSSTLTSGDLYNWAYTYIGQQLSMINGVSQVLVYGAPFAVRVQVDPDILANFNLTLNEVADNLAASNPNLPTGQIDGNERSFIIEANGQLKTADVYEPVILGYSGGAPIRVEDVGRAYDSLQNDRISLRYINKESNVDQPTVVIAILRQAGANAVKIVDAINDFLPQLETQLPGAVELHTVFDKSISIRGSVKDVQETLLIAFALVVMVIFIYLGKVNDTLIPSVVLPLSILITFIYMYYANFTIDNLSLLALTLSIGFVVDDAIVVLENTVRWIEEGHSPWAAAMGSAQQIGFTILSITISLVVVFIPLLFMSGVIGRILQEFAITLSVVTLASGIISLTITPMLCSRLLPPRDKDSSTIMSRFSDRLNHRMLSWYAPALKWGLKHHIFIALIGLTSVLGSVFLFLHIPQDFLPADDMGFFIAYNEAQQGTSSLRMFDYQKEIIRVFKEDPSIHSFVSIAGNPQYRQGINFVNLVSKDKRPGMGAIVQELYKKFFMIPGVNTYIKPIPMIDLSIGSQTKGAYQYAMRSVNGPELYAAAAKVIERMRQDPMFQGVSSDLENQTPVYAVDIDRDRSSALGVSAREIELALQYGYSGNLISRIQTPINQYYLILELLREDQKFENSLDKIYLSNNNPGNSLAGVPLSEVVHLQNKVGMNSVNHLSQFPAVTVSFNIAPGYPLSDALTHLRNIGKEHLPSHVQGNVIGNAKSFEESMISSMWLFLLALFLIYIILGILYESFIHPITILSTLPPAITGGLLTLYIFNLPLSLYSYLGLLLLIGIVKKNGIMVVDYALDNVRSKGESAEQSVYDACLVRFRPIMMTTVAAFMGAIPIAMGHGSTGSSLQPLGLVICGGLILSQLITLFLTPVIYLYLEKWHERIGFRAFKEA